MLRNRNLVPLSHQHQHVLALCVRLDRALQAGTVDLESWQQEIQDFFEHEVCIHFEAEERIVFPAAGQVSALHAVVSDLRAEHTELRKLFAQAADRSFNAAELHQFVDKLARHIRKEERELFEGMQQEMDTEQLCQIGTALEHALKAAVQVCSMRKPRQP
jgi:iron-sulfur cluster repair protein YtfE (RIC family)